MKYIEYYFAMLIFTLYKNRFEGMNKVSDLKDQCEVLLPHGVKLTKNRGKYYIKTYHPSERDYIMFCLDVGVRLTHR